MVTRDVAILLLYDRQGKILLQYRDGGAPTYPDRWAFFGGAIDPGETPEQALAREAWEELEYRPQAPYLFSVQPYQHPAYGRRGRLYCFLEAYQDIQPLRLGEGGGMGWFTLAEMGRVLTIPGAMGVVQEATRTLEREGRT